MKTFHPDKWYRDDDRCGPKYKLDNGRPAQCNPHHPKGYTCCNLKLGECGSTATHCDVWILIMWRNTYS